MLKVYIIIFLSLFGMSGIAQSWTNPILNGLPSYGFKDCYLFADEGLFYVLGTEYEQPEIANNNLLLFNSKNLNDWKIQNILISESQLTADCWFKGTINAPEIRKIKTKYYLTFNGNNEELRPYKKTGFGLGVAENLNEEFKILTPDEPLFYANHSTIIESKYGEIIVIFEMDGRFYETELDLEKVTIKYEPREFLGPETLGKFYKYLDAPNITRIGDSYHLIFSQFYGGYQVKVFHMIAQDPRGPYKFISDEPLYTWLEAEASDSLKAIYPLPNYFAPPTQVVFSNQLVALSKEEYLMVYHTSEKYSEPALCVETVKMVNNKPVIISPKNRAQKL